MVRASLFERLFFGFSPLRVSPPDPNSPLQFSVAFVKTFMIFSNILYIFMHPIIQLCGTYIISFFVVNPCHEYIFPHFYLLVALFSSYGIVRDISGIYIFFLFSVWLDFPQDRLTRYQFIVAGEGSFFWGGVFLDQSYIPFHHLFRYACFL